MNNRSLHTSIASLALFLAGVVSFPSMLQSQPIEGDANRLIEVTLTSTRLYADPYEDVMIACQLSGPGGESMRVTGFWDGGAVYRVRFALPTEGTWEYTITCSDSTNDELHLRHGQVRVHSSRGPNPFYSKGFLRVADNRRHLVHRNGEPFFYLGDTAWEIVWKSREPEVLQYLSDRKRKGFNVLQIVAMSHQFLFDYGIRNRDGTEFFLGKNRSKPNPRYFDYLDKIIRTANDSGFVVALVPLWAGMMEHYSGGYALTAEQSLRLARYIGARYAGSNVIWIVGGDNEYISLEKKIFWSTFAEALKSASGYNCLATVHPRGTSSSADFFDDTDTWVDFHMYQSSHVAGGSYAMGAALRGYYRHNSKPHLNGEATYEDINSYLWLPGDTTRVQTSRIQAVYVRQASYESVLSGAQVGITYGANGIWQWHTAELPGTHLPRLTATGAMALPGSSHMTILKEIMLKLPWYSAAPAQNMLADFTSEEKRVTVAATEDRIVVYLPRQTRSIHLRNFPGSHLARSIWINPSTGDSSTYTPVPVPLKFSPPDTSDWLLVVQKARGYTTGTVARPPSFLLEQNFPNPFNPRTVIRYHIPVDGRATLKVYNLLGAELAVVVDDEQSVGSYSAGFDASNLSTGVYFYRMVTGSYRETKKFVVVK